MPDAPEFDSDFRRQLSRLLGWRRDVRRFRRDPLPADLLTRLIEAAALAPSVGLSQPWRFVVVETPGRRRSVLDNFRRCNEAALRDYDGEKAALYTRLKLAGLEEAPNHLAVFADGKSEIGSHLGRRTMPETVQYSVVCAIHTMWLVARAEGIGLGWVSILEPRQLAIDLDVPPHWHFVAYLCLGYPQDEHDTPELERQGWERRRPVAPFVLTR
jgi:5,6-dimethylbenzimidazole synthase